MPHSGSAPSLNFHFMFFLSLVGVGVLVLVSIFRLDKVEDTAYLIICQEQFSPSTTKSKMHRIALVSENTWRSKEMQIEASPCSKYFTPEEIPTVLRPTRRKEGFDIWVMSFGVIATEEKDVKELALLCKKRGVSVSSHEEAFSWLPENPTSLLVGMWKTARANGAAKIGARISADKKKATTKEAVSKIKDRWPLPSKEWPTAQLLKEAGVSLNTAKAHLGKRPIAQYNYQAALKRKERRNARAN